MVSRWRVVGTSPDDACLLLGNDLRCNRVSQAPGFPFAAILPNSILYTGENLRGTLLSSLEESSELRRLKSPLPKPPHF